MLGIQEIDSHRILPNYRMVAHLAFLTVARRIMPEDGN